MHNLYSTGLLNEILLAPHIFLAYSNLGYYIIKYKILSFKFFFRLYQFKFLSVRKLQARLGGSKVLDFYQEPPKFNFNFCYINCNKNYLINCVENLFLEKKCTMFAVNETYIIHPSKTFCQEESNISSVETQLNEYLTMSYPKNKHLPIVFKILIDKSVVSKDLFFTNFPNIHVADFCSFINNRFGKKETTIPDLIKLCKYLKKKSIKLPKTCIKNPTAQKYFC